MHIVHKKETSVRYMKTGKQILIILLLALFTVLATGKIYEKGQESTFRKKTIEDQDYRDYFYSDEMWEKIDLLSSECKALMKNVENEVSYYPIPESTVDKSLKISYIDTWMAEREYGGKRRHEGTDIMALRNERGLYPVVSMTDGVVTNMGWLDKGGYRIGITSDSGTYYYYAHLDSYANLSEGDEVDAGELLGYMGDSGYGEEGTKGKFDVHLHVGIYSYLGGREVSVNPYYVLRSLENKKLKYAYS